MKIVKMIWTKLIRALLMSFMLTSVIMIFLIGLIDVTGVAVDNEYLWTMYLVLFFWEYHHFDCHCFEDED